MTVPIIRLPRLRPIVIGSAAALALLYGDAWAQDKPGPRHAIAMHGEPAQAEGFTHFRYANPDAPKGGRFLQGILGTFDSLNPYIIKGLAAQAARGSVIGGYVVESLMQRGYDEPFTLYGLLAHSVETDPARSYVTFNLNPAARFSDGKPVTPEDVLFSWQLLRDKGRPNHRFYYSKVTKAEAIGNNAVRFDLAGSDDRELPLILGLMSVLPKHAVNPDTFEATSFEPMIGSGPYVVIDVRPGQSVTIKRNPDYWGRELPVNRGLWNFDEIRFDYYRDANAHFEAFKKGLYDLRVETDSTRWAAGYDFPALREGRVVRQTFTTGLPKPSFFFVFNTRRPIFEDIRVREAISLLYDFSWINKNLFSGLYAPIASYFEGSELSSHGRPADARERALLAPFPHAVRADVLEGKWSPPVTDGSGRDRPTLRRALDLFAAAGYELRGADLVNRSTGKPMSFEIMVTSRDDERLALLFAQAVKRAGITISVRSVDAVQYDRRRVSYDFDMILFRWDQSLSPGNEQSFYFGSAAADAEGTRNYMGVKSPAVDAAIAAMLNAEDRADFVAAVRAEDRVLTSGFYAVPLFSIPAQWVAHWTHLDHPEAISLYGYLPETWWRSARQ
ncbi:MAG: peptide/nickel transport system substrate-binding protein [Alphaproteobacteria bacterium]|jgi:peptide/nickel transport system substrate-binding protein|nr:peptide/nickel transport system substrate-binding protein [Alphaproteobacteria bacterium]